MTEQTKNLQIERLPYLGITLTSIRVRTPPFLPFYSARPYSSVIRASCSPLGGSPRPCLRFRMMNMSDPWGPPTELTLAKMSSAMCAQKDTTSVVGRRGGGFLIFADAASAHQNRDGAITTTIGPQALVLHNLEAVGGRISCCSFDRGPPRGWLHLVQTQRFDSQSVSRRAH